MSIDKKPHFINFTNQIVKHAEFNLGRASAIKIPELSSNRQVKKGVRPNPIFQQKLDEWHQRDLKREQKVRELYKEIDRLCDGIDKPDSVIKTELKPWVKKTNGYFKLEAIKKYIDTAGEYHDKELEDLWLHPPIIDQIPYWDVDYWVHPDLRSGSKPTMQRWDEKIDGKWLSNKEPIVYPEDKKWIEKRNKAIFNIREKFIKRSETWHSYEFLPPHIYKTPQDKKEFLGEVTKLGLGRREEKNEQRKTYDFVDGFHHIIGITSKVWQKDRDNDADLSYSLEDFDKCRKALDIEEVELQKEENLD